MTQLNYCMTYNMWLPEKTVEKMGVNALVQAIEKAIFEQQLKIGDRLPPQRILAYKLNVNPTTVSRAYQRAAQKGLVGGQIGRGTYVLAQSNSALFSQVMLEQQADIIDLSINKLPCDDKIFAINRQIEQANLYKDQHQYYEYIANDMISRYQLAVTQWLQRVRGISFNPNQILPVPSCQYGIYFILRQQLKRGDVLLVEQFTSPGIIAAAKEYGLRLFNCKCDEQGLIPASLDSLIAQTNGKMLITIPSHQSPMGITQSDERRQALAKVIIARDLLVIEEDIYGMFAKPAPLAKYAPNNVLLLSGFSKCLSGGHKISFIAGAHSMMQALTQKIIETLWLISATAASHIITALENNYIEQATEHVINENRRKNQLVNSIMKLDLALDSPHHWINCDLDFVQRAAEYGIKLAHQEHFSVIKNDQKTAFYRLSVHCVTDQKLKKAAIILRELMKKCQN
ncbi:MAG: PLP-dependent aminotransferase family protein [Oceanospirillaceae bacterium]